MKKKVLFLFLVVIVVFNFIACSNSTPISETTTTNPTELSEEEKEISFIKELETALIDSKNADSIMSINSNDEFITHYKLMMNTIKDGISDHEEKYFENPEFNKQYNLFKNTLNDSCELLETTSFNTSSFLSSWFNYYWNFCSAIKYFHDNYSLKLYDTYKDYMLEIPKYKVVDLDDVSSYQGGYTTYKHHFEDTNPDIVINDYEYISLHYLDFENKDAVTDMYTFYIFGTNKKGDLIIVNDFMQPKRLLRMVKKGQIRDIDRYDENDTKDYYIIEGYSKKDDKTVVKIAPEIGMTETEVLNSTWGSPKKVNTTTTKYSIHKQWVYDRGYIYFDNGVVSSIQTK